MAGLMVWASVWPALAQAPTAGAMSREDYEGCQARDETAFKAAIERVTVKALEGSLRGLDYLPIVATEWRKGGIDEVMVRSVDRSLDEIKAETSWGERIASLASRETQEKLAKSAAERAYGSQDMKAAIEALAIGVGREVGQRLEIATADAAEPTTRCLEAFLGPRYGSTVAGVVAKDAGREFAIDAAKGTAGVSRGQVLVEGKEGITGLVVVIMRRQLGNLASRVSQRLVGAVLGRVVSVVAGGIGVALIAKDIWELRNGILPIIASEMKSTGTRDKVQAELARSIATEIEANLREIGKRTSERIIDIWQEFRRAHAKVLELAEAQPDFKRFMENVSPSNLGRLDEVVALQLASGGGEAALAARVADGSLGEAVERWPHAALEIARDRRSLMAGFRWRALAGDTLLPKVVEYELHRRAAPDDLSRAALVRILALEDRVASGRLAALKGGALEPLLELDDARLKRLARGLGEVELASLSGYLTQLERSVGQRLLLAVAEAPIKMQAVAPAAVRDAVLSSRDQTAALAMMLRTGELFDVGEFWRDAMIVQSGAVSPRILLARYPYALAGLAVAAFALLLLLSRAMFGRRPRAEPPAQA